MRSSLYTFLVLIAAAACDSATLEPTPPVPVTPKAPDAPLPPTPSTGALIIRTVTTGVDIDADGYGLMVQNGNTYAALEAFVGVNDSVVLRHTQVGDATGAYVHLRGLSANCWVELPNVRLVPLLRNEITRVDYVLECTRTDRSPAYERLGAHHPGTTAFHGSLSESYVWGDDGRFRLRFDSSRFGRFEYFGSYTRARNDGEFDLAWDGDSRWSAKATIRGDTLSVTYNTIMLLSDFEPGSFVRR